MIIDSFLFFQELDLLEIRLEYLYNHIDKFIIVEACQSFSGKRKKFNFEENVKRYNKYLNKIIYFKITDFHKSTSEFYNYLGQNKSKVSEIINAHDHYNKNLIWWVLDSYHRECIHLALQKECNPNDTVIISDLDEIPSIKIIKQIKNNIIKNLPVRCKQYEFKYYLNSLFGDNWLGSIIAPYSYLEEKSLNLLRMESKGLKIIDNGGYHFTSVGGEKALRIKIESWGHQEFNLKIIKDNLFENLIYGRDIFYRYGHKRNKLIPLESNDIFDANIRNLILNYKDLILDRKKRESILSRLNYRYIQILVYFLQIKNNPKKVLNKIYSILLKLLQRN